MADSLICEACCNTAHANCRGIPCGSGCVPSKQTCKNELERHGFVRKNGNRVLIMYPDLDIVEYY